MLTCPEMHSDTTTSVVAAHMMEEDEEGPILASPASPSPSENCAHHPAPACDKERKDSACALGLYEKFFKLVVPSPPPPNMRH